MPNFRNVGNVAFSADVLKTLEKEAKNEDAKAGTARGMSSASDVSSDEFNNNNFSLVFSLLRVAEDAKEMSLLITMADGGAASTILGQSGGACKEGSKLIGAGGTNEATDTQSIFE